MKKLLTITLLFCFVAVFAQSNDEKKEVRVITKTIEKDESEDGKTFTYKIKVEKDEESQSDVKIIKQCTKFLEDGEEHIEITIESADESENAKTIIIKKPHDHDHLIILDGEKEILNMKELKKEIKSMVKEHMPEGEVIEEEIEHLEELLENLDEHLELDDAEIEKHDAAMLKEEERAEIKAELAELKELKEPKFRVNRAPRTTANFEPIEVYDREIKALGVMLKKNELDVDNFSLEYEAGKLDLNFSLKDSGKTKVKLYCADGTVGYNDKIKDFSGNYSKQFDFDKNAMGCLYVCITQNDASYFKKLAMR